MENAKEAFTADEIVSLLDEIGFSAVARVVDGDDGDMRAVISLDDDDDGWFIVLGDERPFYEAAMLVYVDTYDDSPVVLCSVWNEEHVHSTAYADFDDASDVEPEDGDSSGCAVVLRKYLSFVGYVTPEHLQHLILQWHDDVCEFREYLLGVEHDDVPDVDLDSVPVTESSELKDIVASFLIVAPNRSARDIARFLGEQKHEVNRVLYGNPDLFQMESGQPPRWRTR